MTSTIDRLVWIDAFVERIRPYVFIRLTDRVLIRMPNEAFKLNRTGAQLLHFLLNGGSVKSLLQARPSDESLPAQLQTFFSDLSRALSSSLCDGYISSSLERIPFKLGYIELPVLSEVALTWKCNINCRFCYASCKCTAGEKIQSELHELSFEQVKKTLEVIRYQAEVPSVSFTGGEPVLRSDLPELIAYAAGDLKMRVNLITNGTLISPDLAQDLKAAGLASAQVSIESPNPDVHDNIVGVKNAYFDSVRGLQALLQAGISVHPHTTICRLNLSTLDQMPGFVGSLGLDRLSMNMVIPAGRGVDADLAVRYTEVRDIVLRIQDQAVVAGIRFMWYSPTPLCLFNPVSHQLGNKGCSACEGLLSVDPFGRILPCSSWKEPVGNLLTQDFKTLWFGAQAQLLRNKGHSHPECRDCEHFAVCHGACPLYFRIHGYDELEPTLAKLRSENKTAQRRSV